MECCVGLSYHKNTCTTPEFDDWLAKEPVHPGMTIREILRKAFDAGFKNGMLAANMINAGMLEED